MIISTDNIKGRLELLFRAASMISGAGEDEVAGLTDTLLALPEEGYGRRGGRTGLNSDGSPIQFSISMTEKGAFSRLLSDPAFVLINPYERYLHSLFSLRKLIKLTSSEELEELCDITLASNLPASKEKLSDNYPDGVMWLGAGLGVPGIALYIDGRRGTEEEAWKRIYEWLITIMPASGESILAVNALKKYSQIMCIGIEGSSLENARAKIYWRLKRPLSLNDMELEILKDNAFSEFLTQLAGDKKILLNGLVFSLGIHIGSGKIYDAKIDVCACRRCLNYKPREWLDKLHIAAAAYGIPVPDIEKILLENMCAVSYFGIGNDIKGNTRLNLYLKTYNNG
jgi:hypothetical protein